MNVENMKEFKKAGTDAAFAMRLSFFINDDKSLAFQGTLPYISGPSKLMAKASFNFPLTAKANSQANIVIG